MSPQTIINEQQPGDRPYMVGLGTQTIGLYAPSLWEAKQRAIAYLKPKKRELGLLWVELAEETNPINLR